VDQRGALYLHNKTSILGSPKFFLSIFLSFLVMEESNDSLQKIKILNLNLKPRKTWEAPHLFMV
jgi:hypothetical protein